jgi:hypothetical protein
MLEMKPLYAVLVVGLTACIPPPATPGTPGSPGTPGAPGTTGPSAPASTTVDLVYQVPAGFSETRGEQATTLSYATSDGYSNVSYTIVILPSQPMRGTLTETFQALWGEAITPLFTSAFTPGITPAPLRRRLSSGYAVAFDGELMNSNRGGMFTTVLYLLASGDRVVPILGMFGDMDARQAEPIVSAFLESASIEGYPPGAFSLFDASELVGTWSTQSAEFANYVDSSTGNYAGSSTVAVREDHTFNADGSYSAYASAYQSDRGFDRDAPSGTWRVEDDSIMLETGAGTKQYRVFAVGTFRGVPSIYLPPSYASTSVAEFTRPRSLGDWFGRAR